MDKKKAVGLFVAKRRKERGLSVQAVADAAGISRPYLTQIENGHRLPSDEKFMALLIALGASMEEFMRELLADEIPREQLESMALLTRGFDALQQNATPETVGAVMAATPTPEQMSAALAMLGGMPVPSGPEGWLELSAEDRRLVQRLVNRLRRDAPGEGGDDGES